MIDLERGSGQRPVCRIERDTGEVDDRSMPRKWLRGSADGRPLDDFEPLVPDRQMLAEEEPIDRARTRWPR